MKTILKVLGVIGSLFATSAAATTVEFQAHKGLNVGVGHPYETGIDIDQDGLADVTFDADFDGDGNGRLFSQIRVRGDNGTGLHVGAPLSLGDPIGSHLSFRGKPQTLAEYYSDVDYYQNQFGSNAGSTEYYSGPWITGTTGYARGYLALRLRSGAYGWIDLELDLDQEVEGIFDARAGTVFRFGYSTEPGATITAGGAVPLTAALSGVTPVPVPASLGLLLAGFGAFIPVLRRRLRTAARTSP